MIRRPHWTVRIAALAGAVCLGATTVAVPVGTAAAEATGDKLAAAEKYLREHMSRTRAPGMAYAIVDREKVLRQGAWGVDGDGRAVTSRTPFVLGSTSKSVTALAVMQLVEAGKVDLDTPARRYVPWFRLAADAARRITVRQLLTHTSGLPDAATKGLTDRYDNTPDGLTRSVRDLAALRPTTEPGRTYQYSDANYLVLGVLVESVTGESFGGYLRRAILDPLAMTRSAATEAEARKVGVPAGHRYYFGRPQRFAPPFDTSGVAYGFLAASLDDMTHYVAAQLNGGRYGGTQILSPAGIRQLHDGQVPTGARGSYGFGWRNSAVDGTPLVWHAGAVANSFSHLVLVPGSDLAVVVLANVYSLAMDGPLTAAAFNAVRILHGGTPTASAKDPLFTWALVGLLTIAGLLLAATVWSLARAFRVRPTASRRRVAVTAAAWIAGCAVVALGVAWGLPASWGGAGLPQVLLFAPDIGHSIVAVAGLAALLALVRLGGAVRAIAGSRTAP